ncbi:MAG: nickel pincer cofactor biosynthesis protein LarC [Nitrospirae bacterium]|nr:nickel pincer cofactor biosynthesis protein LarC [Nitrospirota bacterium]
MKIAYFDCFSGISGDMILGALIDAGLSLKRLDEALAPLKLAGYRLSAKTVEKAGIRATKVDVLVDDRKVHIRDYPQMAAVFQQGRLSRTMETTALGILERLARAEAQVHGRRLSQLHFHELGGVDTLVDIAGAVVGLSLLGVDEVYASPLNLGGGMTRAAAFPIPAPATANLLTGVPVYSSGIDRELTTPTGAAIISSLAKGFVPFPSCRVEVVGHGAGETELPATPNVLRLFLGDMVRDRVWGEDRVVQLETNVDDVSPQIYDYLIERLLEAGALDVFLTPAIMKKGRPAVTISVLARAEHGARLMRVLFDETPTLGVRVQDVNRVVLPRTSQTIATPWGRLRVKVTRQDGNEEMRPEYEDCRDLAQATGRPLRAVMQEVSAFLRTVTGAPPLEVPLSPPPLPDVVLDGGVAWGEPIEGQAETSLPAEAGMAPAPAAPADGEKRRTSRHRRRRSRGGRKKTPPA